MACELPLIVVSGMAFEARIAEAPRIANVYGLNPERLAADISNAAARGASGILSFGVAAGLSPELKPGAIIIARQVRKAQESYEADKTWAQTLCAQLPDAAHADIFCPTRMIANAKEKSSLWAETGAAAADMESHMAAQLAQKFGLPFAALRVVLDDASCSLPPAAQVAAKPDGAINYIALIGSLLMNPFQLPLLLRLARADAKARQALLRCSHLLKGSLFGLMDLR